ncbi:Histidine kinase-, DNA gyrase B-, and HSP90-like ATPase [Oryzisolibacter propanilivorax]|uniref:histidine kinase n=1 Tax=Oryzisolibacter propanilivorax TaxID=1527607 RepID=A0A1G9S381_9BURK|nr:ATP-binding protein [Oryzisolibacter propanilivorax]SDM29205.1 Histidine kinase-, DNA gyrase B-, and HSP90-like ATPase [Oryzisolibacter propanilivorax]
MAPLGGAPSADALHAELEQARRQLAEMAAAQEAFMRRVVHDLRAPLRHVTSYGALVRELLGELAQPPEQVLEALDCVATMEQSARRMAAMLEALRTLSEAERAPLRPTRVALDTAVRGALDTLAPRLAGRAVQCTVDEGLPALQADAAQLHVLLVQLLDNALKFTRNRTPACIRVLAECHGPRVLLRIEDNGVGFDPARAGLLFGLFERLHREAEFEGLGCGLALARVIARRHGATLEIQAQPGQGCTVQLDWPAAASPTVSAAPQA